MLGLGQKSVINQDDFNILVQSIRKSERPLMMSHAKGETGALTPVAFQSAAPLGQSRVG